MKLIVGEKPKTKKGVKPTINYFQQEMLFPLHEILELEARNKYSWLFNIVNVRPAAKLLSNKGSVGRNGSDKSSVVRALIAQQVEKIPSQTKLIQRLKDDPYFRIACGFKEKGSVPSASTFSRCYKALTETGILDHIYQDLLDKAQDLGMIKGENIALDSSNLAAYDSPRPSSSVDKEDPDRADWGAKYDSNRNKLTWFGYKLHIACDAASEIPLSFKLTPANETDGEHAMSLVEDTANKFKKNPINWLFDKGYDFTYIYRDIAEDYQGQAITPLNLRNSKTPPPGFADFKGTPQCSGGFEMVYWGHDGNYNKFRCPHAVGKVNCCHGVKWCSDSDYGLVVKTNPADDYRTYSLPHRGSKTWKKLYNKRTSIERVFSYLKNTFNLTNITVKGRNKAQTHVELNLIALLATKIAAAKKGFQEENQAKAA